MIFVPGDLGDNRLNIYILEHFFRWVSGLDKSFWDAPFFYPYLRTIAFSDSLLGSAPFYAFLRVIGFDRESAFQGWYILGFFLNYSACVYVLIRLKLRPLAVAAGSFFFTFGLPMLAQENHAQLVYRFGVPLACFLLYRFSQKPLLRTLLAIAFWLVWQFYLSFYMGYFLVLLLLVMFLLIPMCIPKLSKLERLRFWPHKMIIAWLQSTPFKRALSSMGMVLLTFCLFSLLRPYYWVSSHYGFMRPWHDIEVMLPRIQSYFLADRSLLWQSISSLISNTLMRHEHQLFPGIAALILLIIGIVWRFDSENRTLADLQIGAIFILVIFTLDIGGISLYRITALIPGLNSIRAITRIELVLMWPLALLLAIVLDALSSSKFKWFKLPIMVILLTLLIITEPSLFIHTSFSKSEESNRLTNLRSLISLQASRKNPILLVAVNQNQDSLWFVKEIDAMLLAQDLGWPTLNGYSGNVPPEYIYPYQCAQIANQIRNYINFEKIEGQDLYKKILKRVVPIGFPDCSQIQSNQGP